MHAEVRDGIDWDQPFPAEEYSDRRRKLGAALERLGIESILITSPADVNYLLGYDQIWAAHALLIGAFYHAPSGTVLFIDNDGHPAVVSTTPMIEDVYYLRRGAIQDHIVAIAQAIADRGWATGTIAIQPFCYGPHPDHLRAIGDRWAAAGARIVDGSTIVEDVRLVKSPREVAVIREAAQIAGNAMKAVRDSIREGMRETDIDAVIMHECLRAGGGHPGIRSMIGSGPRSGCHHGPASHRRLRRGDIVHVDFCSVLHRYHVNLSRTFGVIDVDRRWIDLMKASAGCVDAICRTVKVGDPMSRIQEVADAYVDSQALDGTPIRKWDWYTGGYVLGIAFPPDWVHRHRPKPREATPDPVLEPGIILNFENQYDVFDGWPGGTGTGTIDSLLVTEAGIENLSDLTREIMLVGR